MTIRNDVDNQWYIKNIWKDRLSTDKFLCINQRGLKKNGYLYQLKQYFNVLLFAEKVLTNASLNLNILFKFNFFNGFTGENIYPLKKIEVNNVLTVYCKSILHI